jgi:hypothetical protein
MHHSLKTDETLLQAFRQDKIIRRLPVFSLFSLGSFPK